MTRLALVNCCEDGLTREHALALPQGLRALHIEPAFRPEADDARPGLPFLTHLETLSLVECNDVMAVPVAMMPNLRRLVLTDATLVNLDVLMEALARAPCASVLEALNLDEARLINPQTPWYAHHRLLCGRHVPALPARLDAPPAWSLRCWVHP